MDDLISRQAAIDALDEIRHALWEIDIPSPTVPEYVEHHEQVQSVWKLLDKKQKELYLLPSAQLERENGKWTTEEVAELLSNLFGDECACNYNGIDEWLPERCKYTEIAEECPNPKEKHGCWMQFLLQGGADMKGENIC